MTDCIVLAGVPFKHARLYDTAATTTQGDHDMRNKVSEAWARDELEYLHTVDPSHPGKSFSHNADCFARYCAMQARLVANSGHHNIAFAMHAYANQ